MGLKSNAVCAVPEGASASALPPGEAPAWQRVPSIPLALTAILLAFVLVAPVRDSETLRWTFLGVAGFLAAWTALLWFGKKAWNQGFRVDLVRPAKAHYVQGSVQLCVYAYWGWYWRDVYSEVSLIVAQLVFLYAFDALLSWSRGRSWRLGCGPLPIILSANIFLWFKEDWFVFQFALVAVGALGKEFVQWTRDGRRVHIFNPSAFTLALFSIVLIATQTTDHTWAGRIADTFGQAPGVYVVVFAVGLVVQFVFRTTLMTLSAAATIALIGLAYFQVTGTYWFIFTNIPAPVFLGLHLLVTDPATSPRTSSGKILFGVGYGLLTFAFYGVLEEMGAPTVYDKLLPVPILNLSVRWIDSVATRGPFGALSRWEAGLQPQRLNAAYMSGWVAIFAVMMLTGFVQAPHEGTTYLFWKKAYDEGRQNAAHGLVEVVKAQARDGSAAAWNELGMMTLEGRLVEQDRPTALRYFAKSCRMGCAAGSANLLTQYLHARDPKSHEVVDIALTQLEGECAKNTGDPAYAYLVGLAYELGRGRPQDAARAREYYELGCGRGNALACAGVERAKAAAQGSRVPPSSR